MVWGLKAAPVAKFRRAPARLHRHQGIGSAQRMAGLGHIWAFSSISSLVFHRQKSNRRKAHRSAYFFRPLLRLSWPDR